MSNRIDVTRLLCDLVAIRSVNPMGHPHAGDTPVEQGVVEYLENLLAPSGLRTTRLASGEFHQSLLIELPGRDADGGTLFESHIDTVPGDAWSDRAWSPRVEGGRVFGLGSCDDKASLTAMVLAMLDLAQSAQRPPQPVYLLAAGDEEHGQTGIRRFVADGCAHFERAVFGEPTGLMPVIQHKGIVRWEITTHGRCAHTSRPELGSNAILKMLDVVAALQVCEADLQRRYRSELMTGPTLTISMISGGRFPNAVPDRCSVFVDLRILPGMDVQEAHRCVVDHLAAMDGQVTHSPLQSDMKPLSTPPSDPLVRAVEGICRSELGQAVSPQGVPYGTDAAWLPAGCPAIVLGPGSIETAHTVDEHVDVAQVESARRIYRQIMLQDWRRGS